MAETQRGAKAVIWGIYTGVTYSAITTAQGAGASFELQSTTFAKEADRKEVRNKIGDTVTEIFHNYRNVFSIEVIPTGDTKAHALAGEILPAPGDIITITETTQVDPEQAATNSGKYVCDRATKSHTNSDEHKMTFEMHQYVANDTAVAVS